MNKHGRPDFSRDPEDGRAFHDAVHLARTIEDRRATKLAELENKVPRSDWEFIWETFPSLKRAFRERGETGRWFSYTHRFTFDLRPLAKDRVYIPATTRLEHRSKERWDRGHDTWFLAMSLDPVPGSWGGAPEEGEMALYALDATLRLGVTNAWEIGPASRWRSRWHPWSSSPWGRMPTIPVDPLFVGRRVGLSGELRSTFDFELPPDGSCRVEWSLACLGHTEHPDTNVG